MKSVRLIFLISALFLSAATLHSSDKSRYLDLMEIAVKAYTPEHIQQYTDKTDSVGILEHGYARLTSNLGILIAHGRMQEMKPVFERMMDICVRELPIAKEKNRDKGEIGNDFAVKEVCCCIAEIEEAGIFPKEKTQQWRAAMTSLKAEEIYSCQPLPGDKTARNWCVFGSASECVRIMTGMGGDRSYADKYLGDQMRFFDENGMYMDPGQPMVYDFVTRLQYMLALHAGYDGPYREDIEQQLLKSVEPTLLMLSVRGEIPYGGRSNAFLHNNTFYAAVCEYYASWMKSLGRDKLASQFKAAAQRACDDLDYWTSQQPLRHIKNRYPTQTGYGCENYAHFNKYMVTMGSWAYLAYRFADDSIEPAKRLPKNTVFVTSDKFHRVMMNAGGYTAQWDINAQKDYDCNGLGRLQKEGAPTVVALASPCPELAKPHYKLDVNNPGGLAIAPAWDRYSIVKASKGRLILTDSTSIWDCRLSARGLRMILKGSGVQSLTLPAFDTDGETGSEVSCDGHTLTISFKGWRCTYTTNGTITDSGITYGSRNGHLRRFDVSADGRLKVRARIEKI